MTAHALIVVDPQEDFEALRGWEIKVLDLINAYTPPTIVVVTRCFHPKDHFSFPEFGTHCIKGTKGAKIYPWLLDLLDEQNSYTTTRITGVEPPDTYSAFDSETLRPKESLENILKKRKIERVKVIGQGHAWDVPQTALDANALGYRTTVFGLSYHKETWEQLSKAGVEFG